MQSSGDAGVVVVSFGSMVTNLTAERADVIATALGRIPQKVRSSALLHAVTGNTFVTQPTTRNMLNVQISSKKVIWRYSGETPRTLSANTKLYDWIPQNDLLGKHTHTHTKLNIHTQLKKIIF